MKCPNCAAEVKGYFCEYCGSEMPQEKSTVNIVNNYYGDTTKQENSVDDTTSRKCPKCGNSKIIFKREKIATATQSHSRKNYIGNGRQRQSVSQSAYKTIGICQNCGYTWNPNETAKVSKRRTWLWVIGWIFMFPIPLTIILLRKKDMKPAVKYGIIALAWVLFFAAGMMGGSNADASHSDTQPTYSETQQDTQTTDNAINNTAESIIETTEDDNEISTSENTDNATPYPMQITYDNYNGPECWLLSEPIISGSEKLFEVYAVIDTQNDDWQNQTKSVISLLRNKYNDEKVMFKIYKGTDALDKTQPTYEELIAVWQNKPFSAITESKPTITWYPNGGGIAAQQKTENWEPAANNQSSTVSVIYAEDEVVNRFISEFNKNSTFEITDISKGNIRTKYFGYANERYLEMINANNAGAEAFCLKINGGQETKDKQAMYEVFKEAVKILDPSIADEMIDSALAEFDNKDVLIEDYTLGDSIIITYVPTKELSYGKNSCRIDISALNYK